VHSLKFKAIFNSWLVALYIDWLVYMIKTKATFLKGRLLSSQSEQLKKYSKSSGWLKKSRPSNKATFVLTMSTG